MVGVAQTLIAIDKGERTAADRLPASVWPRDVTGLVAAPDVYLRGLAYLHAADPVRAMADFQWIIDHPGVDSYSVVHPVAYVQLARAHVATNNMPKAIECYETFLDLWRDADADVPILVAVKAEYAKLKN